MASVLEHRVLSLSAVLSLCCSLSLYFSFAWGAKRHRVGARALSSSVVVVESESIYLLLSLSFQQCLFSLALLLLFSWPRPPACSPVKAGWG